MLSNLTFLTHLLVLFLNLNYTVSKVLAKGQVTSVWFLARVGILSFPARMAKNMFVPQSRFQLDASRIEAYSITLNIHTHSISTHSLLQCPWLHPSYYNCYNFANGTLEQNLKCIRSNTLKHDTGPCEVMLKIKFEHLSVGMDDARNTKAWWKDVVKNDIRKTGIVNWRQVA
jgi:hypothetical protein